MEDKMEQNRIISYMKDIIACTFSNSEYARNYAKRNAIVQILIGTIAFVMMMRVFPAGLVQNHTLSKQKAYDLSAKTELTGDFFTARDKKLQTVYFTGEHLYQITLYLQCSIVGDFAELESVRFRLYDDAFSCIYEEDIDNKKIAKDGFLTATPDLDVEREKPYYYEILVDEESSAVYVLPVADREALEQEENSTLYIDGIINDQVCLIADFDYSRPLTAVGIILYDVLILAAAAVIYLLTQMMLMMVQAYDERIRNYVRIAAAVVLILAAAALLIYAVVLNRFGGEVWDRLFFTVGIVVAQAWLIGFLWRSTRMIRSKKRSAMSAGSIICLTWRNYIQIVSFGLLFYALCQYANADRNFYHYTNTRWMLIFLAVALLMNFNERQFGNKFSAIWLVLVSVGSWFYCKTAGTDEKELLLARLTCGVVAAWGLLVLTILFDLVRRRAVSGKELINRMIARIRVNGEWTFYIALWVAFSLCMYIYRYEKVWVFTATFPFLAFLFTPDTFSANCRFLKNFSSGILLSFALVTLFCLAHRPYHYWMLYRYGGIFHTVACTGMYLAVVFGVAFARLCGKLRTRKSMLLFGMPEYFVTACAVGFILLTMSRTAFLTTAVTVLAIVGLTAVVYHKKIKRILSELGVLLGICLVSFPMVFTVVRMVPAVVNDPVRYDVEFQDRSFMIYEGDPIDSEKYMTVRRFFTTLFGRLQTSGHTDEEVRNIESLAWQEAGELACVGDGLAGFELPQFSARAAEYNHEQEDTNDISNGRFEIFRDYIKAIGWKGHPRMGPEDKNGNEYAHAHNSYLQVAYNFGLIAGIVFLVLCVMTLWRSIRFALAYGNKHSIVFVPFVLIVVFGFTSLTEWVYHPCIPAGFSFIFMQVVLMRTDAQER